MATNSQQQMKNLIFNTNNEFTPTIIRITLGLVIAAHGFQKLLGWFGGFGYAGTMQFFNETMHFPAVLGFLIIMLESIGAIALVFGFATRFLSLAFVFLALGIMNVHIDNGFFMNWFGNQKGEGLEYFLLWIAMAVSLIVTGGGRFSVDRAIVNRKA
jgi:putative oxidoreductase